MECIEYARNTGNFRDTSFAPKYMVVELLCPKPVLILKPALDLLNPGMRRRDGRCLFSAISVSQKWLSALECARVLGPALGSDSSRPGRAFFASPVLVRYFFLEPEGECPGIVQPGIVRLVDCIPMLMLPCLALLTQHRLLRYRNLDFTAWT